MYYVYTYTDPRNGEVFYVGKGKNKRDVYHLIEAKSDRIHPKIQKIQKIQSSGLEPIIERVASFENESDAYDFEESLITEIGSNYIDEIKDGPLTNIRLRGRGGGSSVLWTDEKKKLFGESRKGQNKGEKNGMYGRPGVGKGSKKSRNILEKLGKTIFQFSIDGVLIKEHPIMKEVCLEFNVSLPTLRKAAISNGSWVVGGCRWSFHKYNQLEPIIESKMGKNPNSYLSAVNTINIYDYNGVLQLTSHEPFKLFCKKYGLPYNALTLSYINGNRLYETNEAKGRANKQGNFKFIGWYAIRLPYIKK